MSRSLPEWIGRSDDEPFPPRVRLRILRKHRNRCAHCTRPIHPGVRWICDHKKAIINGGENREGNGQPLCTWCAPAKDRADVAEKAKVASVALASFGMKPRSGRPVPGSRNTPFKKHFDGRTEWRA